MDTTHKDIDPSLPLKDQIEKYITQRDHVSFAELAREWPMHFHDGNLDYLWENDNVGETVLWSGLSRQGFETISELLKADKIYFHPSNTLTYLVDGTILKLPIAKGMRKYKTPHWLPVTMRPGTSPYKGMTRAQIKRKLDAHA
jgi:hypothetical protein